MKSPLPGPNVLLIGASGAGKTTSIKTLIAQGITPFCLFTEPGFEVIGDIPADKLHWQYLRPASVPWESMIDVSKKVTMLHHEAVTALKDTQKGTYTQFTQLLTALNNFKCDRDGKEYGDVCKWGTDRAIVLDSLSGVNIMVMRSVIGGKPTAHVGEWGSAMNLLEALIQKLCTDTFCSFIMMAHAERETDEVFGGAKLMAATLGKKLAPKIPRFFSEVLLAKKDGMKFTWSTVESGADLKSRFLPAGESPPDFKGIIEGWKRQGGIISPEV